MRATLKLIVGLLSVSLIAGCTTAAQNSALTPSIKRQFVDGLYGQVHVRVAGIDTDKPPLVLLHPTPYSSQFYIPFIDRMRTDRLVIAIDTPGYGDSARPETPPSMPDYALNVIKVLDGLKIGEPVDVVGYHTGTLIAVEMALNEPGRVNKAVLAGIPVYSPERLPELHAQYAKPNVLKQDGSHLIPIWEFATQTMEAGLSLESAQSHYADYMQSIPFSTDAYYSVFSYPGYEQLPKLTRPSLFVAINGSLMQETLDAQKLTPNSDVIYLENVKTGLFDLADEQLAQVVRDYLDTPK